MYSIVPSRRFEKSLLRLKRSGKLSTAVQSDLQEVFDVLARRANLPVSYADHQLHGEYRQYRECHIKGDLLLLYRVFRGMWIDDAVEDVGARTSEQLSLIRIGSFRNLMYQDDVIISIE